jgi:hypothetical protein
MHVRLKFDQRDYAEARFHLLAPDEVPVTGLFIGYFESEEWPEHGVFGQLDIFQRDQL